MFLYQPWLGGLVPCALGRVIAWRCHVDTDAISGAERVPRTVDSWGGRAGESAALGRSAARENVGGLFEADTGA